MLHRYFTTVLCSLSLLSNLSEIKLNCMINCTDHAVCTHCFVHLIMRVYQGTFSSQGMMLIFPASSTTLFITKYYYDIDNYAKF
jgi:hypothetical protein